MTWYKRATVWLCLLGIVAYASSVFNQFVWDDEQFIYRNQYVTEFQLQPLLTESVTSGAGEISNYFRPLTSLSFAIDHAIWGLRPFGFHLTNIALHIGTGALIYCFLLLLSAHTPSRSFWHQWQWWVALFFLIHPVQTEAVTYMNSRGDSLYTFLLLGSLCLSQFFWQKKTLQLWKEKALSLNELHCGLVSLALLIISFFAKEISIVGVALIPLSWLLATLNAGSTLISALKKVFSFWRWLSALALTAVTYLTLRATVFNFANSFNFFDGAENIYAESIVVRLATFTKIFWLYQQIVFIPFPLHMERMIPFITTLFTPWTAGVIVALGSLLFSGWYEYRRAHTAWIWFGTAWYLICLTPVSGIIPINGMMYEHWLYLPIVGWLLVLWRCGDLLVTRLFRTRATKKVVLIALSMLAAIYTVLTIRQNYLWGEPIRFYTYTLQHTESTRLWNNLGMAYADRQQLPQALNAYQKAIELNPNYPQVYHNMGNALELQSKNTEAISAYEQALRIQPDFFFSYPSLVNLYVEEQKYQAARYLLEKMITTQPSAEVFLMYGQVLWQLQEYGAAKAALQRALQLGSYDPQLKAVVNNITASASAQPKTP